MGGLAPPSPLSGLPALLVASSRQAGPPVAGGSFPPGPPSHGRASFVAAAAGAAGQRADRRIAAGSPPPRRPEALPPAAPARASGQPRSRRIRRLLGGSGPSGRSRRNTAELPRVPAPSPRSRTGAFSSAHARLRAVRSHVRLRSFLAAQRQGRCPLTPRARARMPRSASTPPAHPRRPPEPPCDPPAIAGFTGGLDSRLFRVGGCFGGRRCRLSPAAPFGRVSASAFRAARPPSSGGGSRDSHAPGLPPVAPSAGLPACGSRAAAR